MKIVTAVVNNPLFIKIQYYTLKKYFKGSDYEFIVFNDAKDFPDYSNSYDPSIKQQIIDMCNTLNIRCININNNSHTINKCAAARCADAMNYILKYQLEHPDKYLLLDSDMFLIDEFDINKYAKYDCAVVLQSRFNGAVNYIWNGIYYFDMHKMINTELLNWDCCQGCDVGGMMQNWLKLQIDATTMPNTDTIRWTNNKYHTNTVYFIKHLWSCSWNASEMPESVNKNTYLKQFIQSDPRNTNNKYFCEIYDDVFLHYRAGGNWRNESMDFHKYLSSLLEQSLCVNII